MAENPSRPQSPFNPALRRLYGGATAVPEDLGPVELQQSQPGALSPGEGIPIALPGVNFPPAGAFPVNRIGDASIAPGGSATILTVVVPNTFRLRLVGIGFGADDEVALGFLTWSMRADGDPIADYNSVPAPIGSLRQLEEIFVSVGSSVTVTVVAQVNAFAVLTYRYIARVRGWFYTQKEVR